LASTYFLAQGDSNSSSGLSTGAIAGIVISIIVVVLLLLVAIPLVYFAGTRYRRGKLVIYDTPYNYELPPLPPRLQRMDSRIYDSISDSHRDDPQNQPLTHTQGYHKSDGEVIAATNNIAISQLPSTNPDTAKLSATHSYSPSERANLPLNLATNRAEIPNDELGIPSPNTTENVSYQPSTRFSLERNPAYGTNNNIAIASEIETSANIAYDNKVLSQSLATNPDAVVSARPPPSPMHSDLPLERADEGTDLPPLTPLVEDTTDSEYSTIGNTNNKCRVPNSDVDVSEASANFNPVWD
jgi:hypothetical protein